MTIALMDASSRACSAATVSCVVVGRFALRRLAGDKAWGLDAIVGGAAGDAAGVLVAVVGGAVGDAAHLESSRALTLTSDGTEVVCLLEATSGRRALVSASPVGVCGCQLAILALTA